MSKRITRSTARCPECGLPLLAVVMGMPGGDQWDKAERGELLLGGCVIEGPTPNGVAWLGCRRDHWFGGLYNGQLFDERWLVALGELAVYRCRWREPDVELALFDEIGDRLALAQELDRPEIIEAIGPPALRALERRFGIMNEAFHNIGWYVGEMYYLAQDRRGISVMEKTERVLARLEGPQNEVRLDVLAQLGWLAGRCGQPRLAYRCLRERFDLLAESYRFDDPEVVEARGLAKEAALQAGFNRVAKALS